MTTITKADLRNQVLEHMGITQAGEAPSAEDAATVDQKVDYVHEVLAGKGLLHWDTDEIPHYAVLPMISMTAFWCRGPFSQPIDPMEWNIGESGLRNQVSRKLVGEPIRATYY